MPKWAKRKDKNHNQIADVFRRCGCSVFDTSRMGDDFPDFIAARRNITAVIEVKSDTGKPSDGQQRFADNWRGLHAFITTEDEALEFICRFM